MQALTAQVKKLRVRSFIFAVGLCCGCGVEEGEGEVWEFYFLAGRGRGEIRLD